MRTLTSRAAAAAVALFAAGLGGLLASACEQSRADRQRTLERLGDVDRQIAAGEVVRDLRSPWDTGGLIYSTPTNLALSPAAAAPAASSTYGITVPDSARAHAAGAPQPAAPGAASTTGAAAPAPPSARKAP